MIHSLDEVDNVHHSTVRHCGGDITCNRIGKCGLYVGLTELLFPGSLAVKNISEALNKNMSRTKHIRKLPHLLCILYRLIEGHGEIV